MLCQLSGLEVAAEGELCGCACSLKEAFIVTGILLGYLASYLFIDDVGGWRLMYGLAAGPALVVLAGMVSFFAHLMRTHALPLLMALDCAENRCI